MSYFNSEIKGNNISFKELDYTLNNDMSVNIDDRVLKLCREAENNYLENQKKIKEIKSLKNLENKVKYEKQNNLLNSNKDLKDEVFYELQNNKKFDKYVNFLKDNNHPNPSENKIEDGKLRRSSKEPFNIFDNKSLVNNKQSFNLSPLKKEDNQFDLNSLKQSDNTMKKSNEFQSGKLQSSQRISKNGTSKNRHCKACDLKKRIKLRISKMSEIRHEEHLKFQFNVDINNTIIESKKNMKKLNYKKAFEILKLPIIQGVKHSDIFYLFGEVNRILKQSENSEKYLLEALMFEMHSPYVFYSLGLLYQEINNYKESVKMFKHFIQIIETADALFQLSKSYCGLKKFLKASMHVTKAINMNPTCYEYFMFRSQIYEIMGFIELSNDDKIFAKNLRNI